MNKEELYNAITHIDEDLLDLSKSESCVNTARNKNSNKKSGKIKAFIPIAACLAVAIISVIAFSSSKGKFSPVINPPELTSASRKDGDNPPVTQGTDNANPEPSSENQQNENNNSANQSAGNSNWFFMPGDESSANNMLTLIDTPDNVQPSYDRLRGKPGMIFISPGIIETVNNHRDEKALYRIKIEFCEYSDGDETEVEDKDRLSKEAERLFNICNEKGFDNCAFEVSEVTFFSDGEQQVIYQLNANIGDTAFFDDFPASPENSYWLMFINEFV